MSPLVTDDDEYQTDQQEAQVEPIDQIAQKTVETTLSFRRMLVGIGNWLANRKLPDSVKQGMREEWTYVMTGERKKAKHGSKKFTSGPFKSFGPRGKKKGKL